MQDIYLNAGKSLFDFYNQKGGLKPLCLGHNVSPGKTYILALLSGYNYQQFKLLLNFETPTLEHFIQICVLTEAIKSQTLPSKKLRLSKLSRQAISQIKQYWPLELVLQQPPVKKYWLRSDIQPNDSIKSKYLPNFYLLNSPPTHDFMLKGELQSLASGLPAEVIAQYLGKNSTDLNILDACAAPGSKSIQLSQYFKNVTANERDIARAKILKKRTENIKNLTVKIGDAFDAFKLDFDCILLDPTCSGSGTLNLDFILSKIMNCQRPRSNLDDLVKFQIKILNAVLKSNAKLVSYSTCSINQEENEDVVKCVLNENQQWKLVNALPSWPLRSLILPECIICSEKMDSEGFFVALFEKVQ